MCMYNYRAIWSSCGSASNRSRAFHFYFAVSWDIQEWQRRSPAKPWFMKNIYSSESRPLPASRLKMLILTAPQLSLFHHYHHHHHHHCRTKGNVLYAWQDSRFQPWHRVAMFSAGSVSSVGAKINPNAHSAAKSHVLNISSASTTIKNKHTRIHLCLLYPRHAWHWNK